MRSRRSRFETACRIGAFALIGWLLGASLVPSRGRRVERASSRDIESRLGAWSRGGQAVALHGDFEVVPNAWVIDWLAAFRRTGYTVTWSGSPPALALSISALVDPRGGARIDIAAPAGATVNVRDDVSPIDSLRISNLGATLTTPTIVGDVIASVGRQSAEGAAPDSLIFKPILVVGQASWEGRFIVDALEERGWPVVTRFSVAPNVFVAPPNPIVLDTSRFSAVVAVDSSIRSLGVSLGRFVRSGGGLVLVGTSSLAVNGAELAPGSLGPRVRPANLPRDTISLGATGFYPVARLRPDAIALERRPAGVTIAARRVGAGRVIQVGYDDSWRWRMAGGDGSENAHRTWWARIAGAVAYAPTAAGQPKLGGANAPLAYLVDRLGPARQEPAGTSGAELDPRTYLALIFILLLAEWTSRRLRGLK